MPLWQTVEFTVSFYEKANFKIKNCDMNNLNNV